MKIDARTANNIYFLSVDENITKETFRLLKEHSDPIIQGGQLEGMVINLKDVRFIDSKGLGYLLVCINQLREMELKLSLCHVRPNIKSMLELVEIDRVVNFFDSEDEALKQLSP